jgi:hypothetical protein
MNLKKDTSTHIYDGIHMVSHVENGLDVFISQIKTAIWGRGIPLNKSFYLLWIGNSLGRLASSLYMMTLTIVTI